MSATYRRLALRVLLPGVAVGALIAFTARGAEPRLFADVLALLVLVSVGCAMIGAWLIVRRMAMMSDAIGHSILLGIVLMFFVVQDPASPLFVIGAGLAGLLTVFLTESLLSTGLVREDASIGMVFSFLFALALVIMGLFFRDAHVDQHLVLAGGVEFTVLDRLTVQQMTLPHWASASFGGVVQRVLPVHAVDVAPTGILTVTQLDMGPRAVWTMVGIVMCSAFAIVVLWKELKLATFDPALAVSLGFSPTLLNYGLMSLAAVTAVGSFQAVGSILVVALFITPAATAFLLTDDLVEMTGLAVVIAAFDAWLGFMLGQALNANFGGSVALAAGLVFMVAVVLAPQEGLVTMARRRWRQRREFAVDMLLVHLATHRTAPDRFEETAVASLHRHLRWPPERARRVAERAQRAGYAREVDGRLDLTAAGLARAGEALRR